MNLKYLYLACLSGKYHYMFQLPIFIVNEGPFITNPRHNFILFLYRIIYSDW